jgi:hypothetical protein
MNPEKYPHIWKREEDLESLNERIHDGVPIDRLSEWSLASLSIDSLVTSDFSRMQYSYKQDLEFRIC